MTGIVLWSEAADSQSCTMCFTRETQKKLASRLATAARRVQGRVPTQRTPSPLHRPRHSEVGAAENGWGRPMV